LQDADATDDEAVVDLQNIRDQSNFTRSPEEETILDAAFQPPAPGADDGGVDRMAAAITRRVTFRRSSPHESGEFSSRFKPQQTLQPMNTDLKFDADTKLVCGVGANST
jgi:hypothetical protein